jgi:uncharacterized protein (TIGR02466 family)
MTDGFIETWFPTSIYIANNLLSDKLPTYENRIKEILKDAAISRTTFLDVNSSWGDEKTNLAHDSIFLDLNKAIKEHVYEFAIALGYDNKFISTLKLDQMWANISKENDSLYPHTHASSVFSGAFYIKSYEGSKIYFHNKIDSVMPIPKYHNNLNLKNCTYDCLPGRLLLFKSDLLHSTPRQTHGEKIVISFNVTT